MEHVKRGKLKLKGGSKLKPSNAHKHKKHKKKHSKRRVEEEDGERQERTRDEEKAGTVADSDVELDDMTPAQRRHAEHQKKREQEEIDKVAGKTYRERIEELNQYLGSLTEHHDVPRVSAAGNG